MPRPCRNSRGLQPNPERLGPQSVQPTMVHGKVPIVDDMGVSVGSTNFDNRSFRLNDEANLNIYDPAFAAEQVRVFEADRARSRRMTRQEFNERSAPQKVLDALAGVLRGQL
ncbi:MAG: phospholipase D-like domain-containing protein [Verrucomicrobia bacterium]|nr:phospholipase D-like domain-containing protein [Verrucomicrobiota bacterium]